MAWAVRAPYVGQVVSVRPLGRAQMLKLRPVAGGRSGLCAVGHHAPHDDDDLVAHLADLSTLATDTRGSSAWIILGDANADFVAPGGESARAGPLWDRRSAYHRFAATVDAAVILPEIGDSPGGRWAEACREEPYTRLPRGEERAAPSCLDVVVAPRRSAAAARISWALSVDDHAALIVTADVPLRRPPRRWRPVSPTAFARSVASAAEALPPCASSSRFRAVVRLHMRAHADRRSAVGRRVARVPFVARDAFSRSSRAPTEEERVFHRRVAHEALVAESRRRRRAAVRRVAQRGGNVAPRRALHDIASIVQGDGTILADTADIGHVVWAHFARKWGVGDEDARTRADMACESLGHDVPVWTDDDIVGILGAARRPHAIDALGDCALALQLSATLVPSRVADVVRSVAASDASMKSEVIRGVALGKKTSSPRADQIRMLLPQGVVSTVIDVLLARAVHDHVDNLPPVPGLLEGAVAGAEHSASFIAHVARLFVEKTLDTMSEGALMQSDIRAFYDNVDVIKAAQLARSDGLDAATAAAVLRHQLSPGIHVRVSGADGGIIEGRTTGALTGSRLAGALGRVVIRSAAAHLWVARAASAVVLGSTPPMMVATYVDNVLILGKDASGAEATFRELRAFLDRAWGLDLPDASTEILVPRGSRVRPSGDYTQVERMRFLGHILESSGSVRSCWRHARNQVYARAQAAMRVARRAHVPVVERLRALDAVLWPALMFRAPTWPPHACILGEADALQRRCAALALEVAPRPLEDPATYRRRRGHIAGVAIATHVPWSRRMVEAAVGRLRALTEAGPARDSWLGHLLRYRDRAWLIAQRMAHGSLSQRSGFLHVRVAPGRVPPRFEEAVVEYSTPAGLYP